MFIFYRNFLLYVSRDAWNIGNRHSTKEQQTEPTTTSERAGVVWKCYAVLLL